MGDSNLLFESVFKRKLSAADTREYLTQITAEYPYFTPAQFYLLLVSREGTNEYEKLAGKTAVLFNNAWWLQLQLQENQQTPGVPAEAQEPSDHPIETIAGTSEIKQQPLIQSTEFSDIQPSGDNYLPPVIAPVIPEKELVETQADNDLAHAENLIQTPFEEDTKNAVIAEDPGAESENNEAESNTVIEIEKDLNEDPVIAETKEDTHTESTQIEIPVLQAGEKLDEKIEHLHTGHFNYDTHPLVNEPEAEEDTANDKEIAPLNFKLNIDTTGTTEDSITFEPLHTTDYFASLGIKLSGEIPASDKLGKQLKSFTEWLKTMKKIHQDQPQAQSGVADIAIQNLAEKSNKEDEVVTEAMADVLLQQGKVNKAIEVLKKLSLLNPSKSAYFAAKIDQLKEN